MKLVLIVSFLIALLITPILQFTFRELHVEPKWAKEINVTGEIVDGKVVVKRIEYFRFFRTANNYFIQNWREYFSVFIVSLISSVATLTFFNVNHKNT